VSFAPAASALANPAEVAHALSRADRFMAWIDQPHIKWALPIPILFALAPLIWLFFRSTWKELDDDAFDRRAALRSQGLVDYRPMVALGLAAIVLIVQDYYGGSAIWSTELRPWIETHPRWWTRLESYDELLGLSWWATCRIGGYVLPLLIWRLFFRRDSILDFGLRTRGFLEHAWIYAMFVVVMIPLMTVVARQPDFGGYYPFYRGASRSWLDFGIWEALYVGQFFALELFFRGWWVRACRTFGAGAIAAMVVPYAMIHIGKPYLEACGAIVAGTVLGSLSMKTKSIYAGFLVHITVAILMDVLALDRRGGLPTKWSQHSTKIVAFHHVHGLLFGVWLVALVMFSIKIVHVVANARAARRPHPLA
jgi:hypothetical protein